MYIRHFNLNSFSFSSLSLHSPYRHLLIKRLNRFPLFIAVYTVIPGEHSEMQNARLILSTTESESEY